MSGSRTFRPQGSPWGCFAIVLAALVAIAILYGFETGYLPERRFNAATWRNDLNGDRDARVHMVDSLIASGRLDGLTRPEVISLLGPPCDCGYFSDWDLVYRLGMERDLLSIDSEWLVIRMDRNGRIARYELARD